MGESSHDSSWGLIVGLVLAISVHLVAAQPMTVWLDDGSKEPDVEQKDKSPKLGKSNDSPRVTVAWIGYDDYKQLIARKSVTDQPALQNEVDPIEDAPLEINPTPPEAQGLQSLGPTSVNVTPVPTPAAGPTENRAVEIPLVKPSAASRPTPVARPTSIPRDEGESAPVIRSAERLTVQPGSVLVGDGIEIKTARPTIAAVALASTLPRNPQAEITFDHTGIVTHAKLTTSTGSDNFDAPILASLYKWKAKGPKIDALKGTLIFPVTILLKHE